MRGNKVACHRNNPFGPKTHHGNNMVVIARPDVELVSAQMSGVGDQREISTGLFHPVYLGIGRQKLIGLSCKAHPCAGRNIIENHGQFNPVRNKIIVLDKTGLGRFVVVWRYNKKGVSAGILGLLGKVSLLPDPAITLTRP